MFENKCEILKDFREYADKQLYHITRTIHDYKKQASLINATIKSHRDEIMTLIDLADRRHWDNERALNLILLIHYVTDVVMLEYRNKVWPYEYMAFARRIGELWEPFCKEAFYYPVNGLNIIDSPDFSDVQNGIKHTTINYINSLNVELAIKKQLCHYYEVPWSMVDSGGIKLELDLHFSQNGTNYNCDFKSGFSSNEKGNTNRLLLVASIYKFLDENEKMILFVRQSEEQNNHYLQTLKNSGYWEVYCANEAYDAMCDFTGFNLRAWLDENAKWEEDIDDTFRKHLMQQDLLKYLTW
ncbi:MAG: hypothetical protein K6G50_03320 [bacterium]|nr:hypothetical protein [bacterium]